VNAPTNIPSVVFPDMTLRSAAVVPPIANVAPAIPIPIELGTAVTPSGAMPM
jgi:hypothetical protein